MKFLKQVYVSVKRLRLTTQVLLVFLVTVKLVLGSVFLYRAGLDAIFMGTEAVASETQKELEVPMQQNSPDYKQDKIDINFIIKKKAALEEEEKRLAEKEAGLMAIQQEINSKIAKLARLRDEIRAEMTKKKTAEEQKFKHLIKAYSAMKPQNAAGLIEKLDKQLAIKLLSKMKGENVGEILSYVDIEKAAQISEGLVKKE